MLKFEFIFNVHYDYIWQFDWNLKSWHKRRVLYLSMHNSHIMPFSQDLVLLNLFNNSFMIELSVEIRQPGISIKNSTLDLFFFSFIDEDYFTSSLKYIPRFWEMNFQLDHNQVINSLFKILLIFLPFVVYEHLGHVIILLFTATKHKKK